MVGAYNEAGAKLGIFAPPDVGLNVGLADRCPET
jgi:hypothetical protein